MANILTDPPFAANPPVKLNIDAKIIGLVIAILAVLGAIGNLFIGGLLSAFSLVGGGFTLLWVLGNLVGAVGDIIAAVGGFQMFNGAQAGKRLVIYGLAIGVLGSLVHLIGVIIAYAGIPNYCVGTICTGYSYVGDIIGFIIYAIIYFIVYYMVVISRFPGEPRLNPAGGGGGYGAPPPPPPA